MGQTYTPGQAAEYLRIAVPLMNKYSVPPTPQNYAVWFKYVAGEEPALKERIDSLKEHTGAFTEKVNDELFHAYGAECDVREFERIKHNMVTLLREFGQLVVEAGRNVDGYHDHLSEAVADLEQCDDMDGFGALLRDLMVRTQSVQSTTKDMQAHFDKKSAEIEALQKELERERRRASTDPLTGIPNRQTLQEAINDTLIAEDCPQLITLVMIDIDHFKQFNDNFGHLIGDRVIKFVASLLTKHTRGGDTPARFGGEEFAVLLPNTSLDGAQAVAENLRKAVAESKLVRSDTKEPLGQITVSAGVAQYRHGEEVAEWIERADQCLYASKNAGRNRVTVETKLPARIAS